ncbi:MAG TPA: hypothetical protein GXX24_07785 [Paracoccus solventivorans]|uniref:Outer membrane lipoprotein n=1 Tax=Paracoccus solventivorans TaxID=53463 RepID=A0A832PMZ7_9RHOB|nr:hypothetical protein [Paracoccus solventivorans]HHW34026.1 hypothetical protein [Paracoccus solventivorans]
MKLFSAQMIILCVTAVAACTPAVTVTSRLSGQQGTGTLENAAFGNSGKMSLAIGDEQFVGTWMAVRDTGFLGRSADAGVGNAVLRSNKGNHMTCEFKYSMSTYTGLGICIKNEKETFDLQAKLT